jgi:hypothetical protein
MAPNLDPAPQSKVGLTFDTYGPMSHHFFHYTWIIEPWLINYHTKCCYHVEQRYNSAACKQSIAPLSKCTHFDYFFTIWSWLVSRRERQLACQLTHSNWIIFQPIRGGAFASKWYSPSTKMLILLIIHNCMRFDPIELGILLLTICWMIDKKMGWLSVSFKGAHFLPTYHILHNMLVVVVANISPCSILLG